MKKFKSVIVILTIFFMIGLLFGDANNLNALFISYNDNLAINEYNLLNVDYDKIAYNDLQNMNNNNENNAVNETANVQQVSSQPVATNVQPVNVQPVVNNPSPVNKWVWPTEGSYTITTYFSSGHNAIDIYAYAGNGSNIYAANSGVVTSVKGGCVVGDTYCNGRGGNYIVIKHNTNNYYTVYMHLKSINVNVGDTVSAGQVIGKMGNTGNVIPVPTSSAPYNGTHLHFCLYVGEPYRGGYAINPMNLY